MLKTHIYAIVALFLCAIGLAELYHLSSTIFHAPIWLSALVWHFLFLIFIIKFPFQLIDFKALLLKSSESKFYIPGFFILLLCLLYITSYSLSTKQLPTFATLSFFQIASVSLIPIGEEYFFRGIIGQLFRSRIGTLWGAYYSAVFFSLMHSLPTLANIAELNIGIVFGPLCLAFVCEWLVVKTHSLRPAVFLHICANLSAVVYSSTQLNNSLFHQLFQVFYH